MALDAGEKDKNTGMGNAIYVELEKALSETMKPNEPTDEMKAGWKNLAYAIANGVVQHLQEQSEIKGVVVEGEGKTYNQTNVVRVE